jgi:protein-S-isoprenylcysteine O-methyltransferase Ste14
MTITTILTYLLIVGYFAIERSLRKGQPALNLQPGLADAGSSQVLLIGGLINLMLAIAAPILNSYQLGNWQPVSIGWLGLLLMIAGLALRYWAATVLGESYTRTLQVIEGQEILDQSPYNIIRHPGYLGTLLLEIGAGLAVTNWIVCGIAIVIGLFSRIYRITVEETMLIENFGEKYQTYADRTWRLLPFLY